MQPFFSFLFMNFHFQKTDLTEILDKLLFIGSSIAAKELNSLKSHNIGFVINATKVSHCQLQPNGRKFLISIRNTSST